MQGVRRWFLILFCLFWLGAGLWSWRAPASTQWQTVAPGVEMRVLSTPSATTLGGRAEIVAIRTTAAHLKVGQGSTLDVAAWRKNRKALAVINGGFFDESGKTLGLRVADGKKTSSLHGANWGVFFIRKNSAGVLQPHIRHTRDFREEYSSLRRITQAVQSGPRLVVAGKTTDLKPQIARRSGVGIQRDGKIVLAVSDSALAFDDWARLWASRSGLNCRDALNLDGGGSTQLSLQTKKKAVEVSGAWPVPDVLLVY